MRGVQTKLRVDLSNFRSCNVGITYGKGDGVDVMIYIPSFIKTGSGIEKLTDTDTETGN
jgi:hypothetical protein